MIEMHTSNGITTNYMGSQVHVPFYSVYKDNYLVIRTSDKILARSIYTRLIGPAASKQDLESDSRKST